MEETDRKILTLLAADGRMSFTDLGKATGLSTSAVHQRVKRLEKRGLIKGYGATIDHDQIGLPLTAFVSITPIDPSEPDDYPQRLADIVEIESCWSVAGEESYILKVRVATGFTDETFIEVVEGLEIGDQVVSVGHGGLKEGTRIRDLTSRDTSATETSDTASSL